MPTADALPLERYDSDQRAFAPFAEAAGLWRFRGLVAEFILRDLKVRHKRALLGLGWAVLSPLASALVLTAVFSSLLEARVPDYPVFLLSASLFWTFFAQCANAAAGQAVESDGVCDRFPVPRSAFVAAIVGHQCVQLALSALPLLAVMWAAGRRPAPAALLVPLAVVPLALFTAGAGYFLHATAARFNDVREILLVLLQAWFFLTPIAYPAALLAARHPWLVRLNPLQPLLALFRTLLYDGAMPDGPAWLLAGAIGAGAALLGFTAFALLPARPGGGS